ncbi:MAG: 5'/3'-nucleotidase SurE [Cyanobacteria bacterium SBLK]|nr:5'/3'-nucleotidase SurE [Cyanobacteria bacterium SBLK]
MVLILTNDDGIDAPGIQALQKAVKNRGVIVAPQGQLSGCSHQVTTSKSFEVKERSPREYAVAGTPADCTRVATFELYPEEIDWVLSGINAGGNLGVDVYISGTVAAAREAAIHNIPAIAISHWIKRPLTIDWEVATEWTAMVLDKLLTLPLPPKAFWNVNFPHLEPGSATPEIVFCQLSCDPLPLNYEIDGDRYSYRGRYPDRPRARGTDVDLCFNGNIVVTQLTVGNG